MNRNQDWGNIDRAMRALPLPAELTRKVRQHYFSDRVQESSQRVYNLINANQPPPAWRQEMKHTNFLRSMTPRGSVPGYEVAMAGMLAMTPPPHRYNTRSANERRYQASMLSHVPKRRRREWLS